MTKSRHSLSEKDTEARKATCSICGPVRIGKAGTGWVCATKQKEHTANWRARHPERDHGRGANPHQLTERVVADRTARCVKCGPVAIEPWARGWICSNRAKELGRVVQQEKPQAHCRDCMAADGVLVWLGADGCARCNETDLNAMFAADAADDRLMAGLDD